MRRPTLLAFLILTAAPAIAWEHWGGDRGGMRFSPLALITPADVGDLVRAWKFRTGDRDNRAAAVMARTKFQSTVAFRLARPGEAPSLWSRTIDRPGGRFCAMATLFALAIGLLTVTIWRWRRARRHRVIAGKRIVARRGEAAITPGCRPTTRRQRRPRTWQPQQEKPELNREALRHPSARECAILPELGRFFH